MTKFEQLVEYTNSRLATAALTLSPFAITEMAKRCNKKETDGGYSNYWKE